MKYNECCNELCGIRFVVRTSTVQSFSGFLPSYIAAEYMCALIDETDGIYYDAGRSQDLKKMGSVIRGMPGVFSL